MIDYTIKHHQNQKLLARSRHDIMLIFHHIRVGTYVTRIRRGDIHILKLVAFHENQICIRVNQKWTQKCTN